MMEDWKEHKFSEIADFSPKIKMEKGKEYPFVLMDEVDAGFKYVRASFTKKYDGSGAKFENGDTLFARITPSLENGKIAQIKDIDRPAFGSTEFFVFRGKKNVSDSDFIYYLSKTDWFRQNAINSFVGASGRQRADAKFVGKTILKVPPLHIQQKIAKILSAYDDLIENNLQRIKLLEEITQKTYEDWFLFRKIEGKIIKDSEIEFLPLEELIQKYMNGGWGKEVEEGGYILPAYVIRGTDMPDISRGYFERLPLRFHTKGNFLDRELINGDIIIEMSNGNIDNVGRSFYFNEDFANQIKYPAICASFCKMLRPKNIEFSFIIDSHLKYIYHTNRMLVYKSQAANGINNFRFEDMIIDELLMIPKGELLNRFVNSLKPKYQLISNFRNQIKLLKEAREILLPRLLTGIIDVEKMTEQVDSVMERELTMAAEDGIEYNNEKN